jgi:hypothetical protein
VTLQPRFDGISAMIPADKSSSLRQAAEIIKFNTHYEETNKNKQVRELHSPSQSRGSGRFSREPYMTWSIAYKTGIAGWIDRTLQTEQIETLISMIISV